MLVLGLDISTSVTGYALIDTELPPEDCLIKFDGIHLSKNKCIYEKADKVLEHLAKLKSEYSIEKVYVEEALQHLEEASLLRELYQLS